MKGILTLTALLATLALPPAATGQTCEEMKAGADLLTKAGDHLIAEGQKNLQELKIQHKNYLAGKIDKAQALRELEKSNVRVQDDEARAKAVHALWDALIFTAKAKGCYL